MRGIVLVYPLACFLFILATRASTESFDRRVSPRLFAELEELASLTAIAYCVGTTGIQKPFSCLSRCAAFPNLELIQTWTIGLIESGFCGYVALSHPPAVPRILVAFRGTQSITDAVYDLMTAPAEYVPYSLTNATCKNCTVHAGFAYGWNATREIILPVLQDLILAHPDYELVLTGHSLGGAVAGLAALELSSRGYIPTVTTFGEPRFANAALVTYIDQVFPWNVSEAQMRYRRVTHVRDPVPMVPFEEWGWAMHSGEIYISKDGLPPESQDLERCEGPEDPACIASLQDPHRGFLPRIPGRWRGWELLFSHREYFCKMGLCFDPQWRDPPQTRAELPWDL